MQGERERERNIAGLEPTALGCSLTVENGEEKGVTMRCSHSLSV